MRLDPKGQENYALQSGNSYIQMGRYLEAIEVLKAGAANNPWVHVQMIYAYTELGREADARAEAKEVVRLAPTFSLDEAMKRVPNNWDAPGPRHYPKSGDDIA